MHHIKRFVLAVLPCIASSCAFCGSNTEIRRAELESYAKTVFFCEDMDDPNPVPTPNDLKEKYNLTSDEIADDIRWLVCKYGSSETNEENRLCREKCVSWLGMHGCTNDIPLLLSIINNPVDYAREDAIWAGMNLLKHSPDLISFARLVVTNTTSFPVGVRSLVYVRLKRRCQDMDNPEYIDDPNQHARIAAFFLERAALERASPLLADDCACRLNPSYRHSQQRRDNLAAARPPNLTGKPAELYDAAQADAAQSD